MATQIRHEHDVSVHRLLRPLAKRRDPRQRPPLDRARLCARLRSVMQGDVMDDAGAQGLYAQDASNYYHIPIAVLRPRTRNDVIAAVHVCRQFGAPITCRGGGTGLAGQTCNEAVIIDFSRYMTEILGIDVEARRARVEP